MQAIVHVNLKRTVLDPQGRTIQSALNHLGYHAITDVRQGKYFEIELEGIENPDAARAQAEKIAREMLANPVIEDYRVEIKE